MKTEWLRPLENLPYFTFTGFKQLLAADEADAQRVRELLSRWAQQGQIIRLKKGVYMARRFFERHQGRAELMPAVSAILVPQSYLSLEYVLQRASVLTDITYPITAVTPKNTREIENPLGTFVYRHVKAALYTGFTQESFAGVIFNQASVAKALFDYFYLRPLPRSLHTHTIDWAEELRLNLDGLTAEDQAEFARYITLSDSPKMQFILENLRRTIWRP